jgi:hypothetical protein
MQRILGLGKTLGDEGVISSKKNRFSFRGRALPVGGKVVACSSRQRVLLRAGAISTGFFKEPEGDPSRA